MIKQFAKRCCAQQQWKRVVANKQAMVFASQTRLMSGVGKKPIQQQQVKVQQQAPIEPQQETPIKAEATPIEATSSDDLVIEIDSMQTLQMMLQKSASQAVIVDCYAEYEYNFVYLFS